MKFFQYIFLLTVFSAWVGSTSAQTDPLAGKDTLTLENERIEDVIDSNKPRLNPPKPKAPKPSTEDIRYDSKDFQIETDFQPNPPNPRPIELQTEEQPAYGNMVKLGFGRFSTPLLQLYLNNAKERDFDYGVNFTHHSSHNDKIELRNFRQDYGSINGSLQSDVFKLYGKFDMYNTAYSNYANTTDTTTVSDAMKDTLGMGFSRIGFSAGVMSLDDPDLPYYYDLGLKIRSYTGQRENREFHFDIAPTGGFFITEDFSVDVEALLNVGTAKIGGINQRRNFLGFKPAVVYEGTGFQARLGFAWNRFKNNIDSVAYSQLGPWIEASFALFPEELNVIAGVTSGMTYNNYYDMIYENPYLSNSVEIKPTLEKLNVYGGIKGNFGQQFDYSAKVYYKRIENPLIYFTPVDGTFFTAIYDSLMTVVGVHAEVNYDLDSDIKAGAAFNLNTYNTSTIEKNFHAPPARFDIYAAYTWNKKLIVNGELNVYSQTPVSQRENGQVFSRGTFVNVGLSADYRITDKFSVYLKTNNLLSGNYQRWHNYPERPIDFSGGLTFIF